ncbi:MAG TPA: mechanosensitive ion channel family protein [Bacteroidetes bacterium]|nr:mechanosensitive ion channel family protein [Bacteroidota bacterium]
MEQLITSEFWQEIFRKALNWAVTELPSILILTVIVLILLRVSRFGLRRLKMTLVHRAEKNENVDTVETEKRINTLLGIIRSIISIIIWAMYIMILLKKFGVDIGPIIASAGIIGLAIGFGAQELVRDVITGFFILLENQVRTGDVAVINGTGGLVEKIEMRTITLRDFSGVVHIFQNGKINTLSNMTKEWSAMVFDVGVAYKEDTDQVALVMKEVGEELQNDPEFSHKIIEPLEIFGVDQFGDSAVVIKARLKTMPGQQWTAGREYRRRLKKAFDSRSIEIPFPHTTIYWGEEINPLRLELKEIDKPVKG